MDNYNYPIGADTADAPWNEEEPERFIPPSVLKRTWWWIRIQKKSQT